MTNNKLSISDHFWLSLGSGPPSLVAHHECQGTLKKFRCPSSAPEPCIKISMNGGPRIWILKSPLVDSDTHPIWGNHSSGESGRGHIALLNVIWYIFMFYSSYWKFNSDWLFKTYPLRFNICLIGISYYTLVLRATVETWHKRRHCLNKLIT